MLTNVLINEKYLKANSPIPLNFNIDEVATYVKLAEELYVKPLIGGILYEELKAQIRGGEISPENQALLLEIYKLEGFAVAYEALPVIAYHFSEVGVTKGKSENSDSIDTKELNYLQQHLRAQVEARKDYLLSWLHNFGGNYPLLVLPQCKVQPLKEVYKPKNPCTDIK